MIELEHELVHIHGRQVGIRKKTGRQPTLVLLHGAGCNPSFFAHLASHLEGFALFAPAFPGRDGSEGPNLERVSKLADWLHGVFEKRPLTEVVLLGHSMGGAVAMQWLLTHHRDIPMHAKGLVLMASGATLHINTRLLRGVRNAVSQGTLSDAGRFAYHPDTPTALVDEAEQLRSTTPTSTTIGDWYATHGFDCSQSLHQLDTPTLILAGDQDIVSPLENSHVLQNGIPRAQLEVLKEAGHMFPIERAEEVSNEILKFLKTL